MLHAIIAKGSPTIGRSPSSYLLLLAWVVLLHWVEEEGIRVVVWAHKDVIAVMRVVV